MRRKVKVSAAQLDFFSRLVETHDGVPAPAAPVLTLVASSASSAGAATRVFLGFAKPALVAIAEHLVALAATRTRTDAGLDLADVIVAVPGARAGRRLLELLVESAGAMERGLVPPRIVTAGALAGLLAGDGDAGATELARRLAWGLALRDAPALRPRLVAHPPSHDDLSAWAALGGELASLADELDKASLRFADVAKKVRGAEGLPQDDARWDALAELEPLAEARLASLGARDARTARRAAVEDAASRLPEPLSVVLACVADLPAAARTLVGKLGARATVLVHAEEADAARFDALGGVVPSAWTSARIEIDEPRIAVCDGPVAQAARVVEELAALGERSIEDVAVGVPDAEVTPHLVARLEDAGTRGRDAAGVPVSRTAPYALLAAAGALVERDGTRELAALVRHPHLDAWLRTELRAEAHEDLAGVLDRHHEEHLPAWIGDGPVGSDAAAVRTRTIVERVRHWLGEVKAGTRKPLSAWSHPVLALLSRTYGDVPLSLDEDDDRLVVESLRVLRDALAGLDAITDAPEATAADAIALLLADVAAREVHPAAGDVAVELLGWLDLAIDDAPVCVVTGLVEGRLPGSITAHPFLPDALRTVLGLDDDATRHARDAHALRALLRSHERVLLVTARSDADGNPLAPSRLLLADDDEVVARRVRRFYQDADAPPPVPPLRALAPGRRGTSDLPIAAPRPPETPIDVLPVTAFRDYLACPYRFYLKHVEKLRTHDDAALELDAASFGRLAHDVLRRFGESEMRDATDAADIEAFVRRTLDEEAQARYGDVAHPSVRLQLAQLHARLRTFARLQAEHAKSGFRIVRTELEASEALAMDDAPAITLRGRIDRIDARGDELWVIDYKLPERATTPEEAHRSGDAWTDLQLPLYRALTARLAEGRRIVPAYFTLPRRAGEADVLPARWDDATYDDAMREARRIVRDVRGGVFWPPAPPRRHRYTELAVLLQEGQLGARVLEEEERREAEKEG